MSPWRRAADRKQDAADLIRIYQTLESDFDRDAAIALAGKVFPGADKEFEALLDRIDRGEEISF